MTRAPSPPSVWLWAFGYFACYVPYSALTKALTGENAADATGAPLTGVELLPLSTLASVVGMFVFLAATGWWRAATRRTVLGLAVPTPTRWTLLSGLATAGIIGTTTLSYTFAGASIVFMMLLMRGGVLVIAPVVDALAKRHVRWPSWAALALSLAAVVVATVRRDDLGLTWVAVADVSIYLAGYFVRLRFMSRLAKGTSEANRRYFVEEQLVASPAIFLALVGVAALGPAPLAEELTRGFFALTPAQLALTLVVGLCSQGTGVFGALILLDARETTFCVPVNRASSILAGVVATAALWAAGLGGPVSSAELVGAALVLFAIVLLALPAFTPAGRAAPRPG